MGNLFYETFTPWGEPGYTATHLPLEDSISHIRRDPGLIGETVNIVEKVGGWNEFDVVARDVMK